MNILKRRPITLLELMIAIGLTMVILTSVTFFYNQAIQMNRRMDIAENEAFKMLYVESRLSSILPKIPPESDPDIEFFFFSDSDVSGLSSTGSHSLVFTFDNGVKLDKEMSYYVVGRLFVDNKRRLILGSWPMPKRWTDSIQMKKEILMENVDSLQVKFFVPPEKGKKNAYKGWPVGEGGQWISAWSKEVKKLPPLIKILVTRSIAGKKETITYAFHLPNTSQPITFDQ